MRTFNKIESLKLGISQTSGLKMLAKLVDYLPSLDRSPGYYINYNSSIGLVSYMKTLFFKSCLFNYVELLKLRRFPDPLRHVLFIHNFFVFALF